MFYFRRISLSAIIFVPLLVLDQWSKIWATINLKHSFPLYYWGGLFQLRYAENSGAWGSLGENWPYPIKQIFLTALPLIITILLLGYILLSKKLTTLNNWAYSLILAGGVGNLIDRIRFGFVVDFMYMGTPTIHTNIFNVADVSIMVGLGLFLFSSFLEYRHKKKSLILILFLLPNPAIGATPYTLKDLKILQEQRNYEEFFLHARDIRPLERNQEWKRMVQLMAVSLIDFKAEEKIIDKNSFEFIEKISRWPSLRQDLFFQRKRGEQALAYFKRCLKNKEPSCPMAIDSFWHNSPRFPLVGYSLATSLVAHYPDSKVWKYLAPLARDQTLANHCLLPFFQQHLLKELRESKGPVVQLLSTPCWEKSALGLKETLLQDGTNKEMLFQLLESKKALSQEEEDYYFTLFVLDGSKASKIFNRAWNRLKVLGKDFPRRKKVLQKIMARSHLPDGVVGIDDSNRRETVIDFIAENFPEYFNSYGKVCLNYLEGKIYFPRGNPTLRCREFFGQTREKGIVSYQLYHRFAQLQKEGKIPK